MRRKVFIKGLLFCLLFTFFSSLNQRVYANEDLFKDVPDMITGHIRILNS